MMSVIPRRSILTHIVFLSIILISSSGMLNHANAEEYNFVAGIHNEITFHFRDGIEIVNFPVFFNYHRSDFKY